MSDPTIAFCHAQRQDVPVILSFIKELAAHEGIPEAVHATEAELENHLFDENSAKVLFICENGKKIGFALYFYGFSSYPCKPYLFINDLFISKEHRGKGYGKFLMNKLIQIAEEKGCCRLEWLCFEGNSSGIRFYETMDAELKNEFLIYRKTILK